MRKADYAEGRSHLGGLSSAIRFCLAVLGLLTLSFGLGRWLRPELETCAQFFFEAFGVWGAALGTWLADGLHFPVPPQVYMLLAEANGSSFEVFPAVVAGSLAGGATGYLVAPVLMRVSWLRSLVERSQAKVQAYCETRWLAAAVLLSVSPMAFSWLCYAAALYRLPKRLVAALCVLRIPKLALYQQLISWGWS